MQQDSGSNTNLFNFCEEEEEESESCSMSSIESVGRTDSESNQSVVSSSAESGACMSVVSSSEVGVGKPPPPTDLRGYRPCQLISKTFQVLSPISDKSQEQSASEQGTVGHRTPKVFTLFLFYKKVRI